MIREAGNGRGAVIDGKMRVIRNIVQDTERHFEAYYQHSWIFIVHDPLSDKTPYYAYIVHPTRGQILDEWLELKTREEVIEKCLTTILKPAA